MFRATLTRSLFLFSALLLLVSLGVLIGRLVARPGSVSRSGSAADLVHRLGQSTLDDLTRSDPSAWPTRMQRLVDSSTLLQHAELQLGDQPAWVYRRSPGPEDSPAPLVMQLPGTTHDGRLLVLTLRFHAPPSADPPADWLLPGVLGVAALILLGLVIFIDSRKVDAEADDRVRATFDLLSESVVMLDRAHRIVLCNRTFAEAVGQDDHTLVGHSLDALPCWQHPEGERLAWLDTLLAGEVIRQRGLVLRVAGVERRMQLSGSPLRDDRGQVVGALMTLHDTTQVELQNARLEKLLRRLHRSQRRLRRARHELEQRVEQRTSELLEANQRLQEAVARSEKIEQELRAAIQAAEAANEAKNRFLANTSHEIRTPLGAIIGHAEMLLGPALPRDESRKVLESITRNAHHLLQIINDVLDLSKIKAGKLELLTQDVSPWQVVQETLGLLRIHAQEKGVRLEAYLDGLVPRLIKGDPTRLRQILVNFVGNAIKFTPAGKRVSLRLEGHPEPPTLRFSVSDEGIGMTPEQQARLFQPFEQGDPSPRRRSHGTGLGLSISRHLADAMGARITVESQVDHGSTFTLELTDLGRDLEWVSDPLAAQRLRPAGIHRNSLSAYPVSSNPELSGRILLVEDNPDNQRMLVYHLRSMGLEVDVAADGVAGVVQALEGKHALILMDMQMPEMDGYTATLRLRERGYDRPIIALTAHATVEDRDRCLEAGCNDYLTKPVDLRRLQASIAGLMQERAPREEVIHSTFHDDPHFREILKQYVQGLAGQVDRLRQAASAERLRLVHQMKGAAGMYGYPQFGELAAVLEAALHERREDTLINELLDEMEIMANQIFQGL